jgi:hypothetical protein
MMTGAASLPDATLLKTFDRYVICQRPAPVLQRQRLRIRSRSVAVIVGTQCKISADMARLGTSVLVSCGARERMICARGPVYSVLPAFCCVLPGSGARGYAIMRCVTV